MVGLLDVGYTQKFEDQEMVALRRNITVGIGCICKPSGLEIQRVQQTGSMDFLRNWIY